MVEKSLKEDLNLKYLGGDLRDTFLKDALEYLLNHFEQLKRNQTSVINSLTKLSKDPEFLKENLSVVLNFQTESSKLFYATIALIDKLIYMKEGENGQRE